MIKRQTVSDGFVLRYTHLVEKEQITRWLAPESHLSRSLGFIPRNHRAWMGLGEIGTLVRPVSGI